MTDFNTRMGCHVWKEGRKERNKRKERERKEPAGHFQFYPSALWLAKSKIKLAILLTIVKLEDHGLILAWL